MKKPFKYILIFLITANLFALWIIFDFLYYQKNEVSFLSVGQGDAELIQIPAGNILIDAGPDAKILSELDQSLSFYDKTIDLFILSHPNKDHFNGLFDILERYEVRAVMLNNLSYSDSLFQKLLQELDKRKILIIEGMAGTKVSWGKQDNLLVIYPDMMVSANQDPNKFSLVNILTLGQNCFLFTGDIDTEVEKELLNDNLLSDIDVLKVAHHGSRFGSSELFLKTTNPEISVIEVGKNSYGHPTSETLNRLSQINSHIFRTDESGTIKVEVKDSKIIVSSIK